MERSKFAILESIASSYLCLKLHQISPTSVFLTIRERNQLIRSRFEAGEGISDLARQFDLSPQRVYQIVLKLNR
ncbi:Mor transcription activator family protein [Chloroflexota bacterium]